MERAGGEEDKTDGERQKRAKDMRKVEERETDCAMLPSTTVMGERETQVEFERNRLRPLCQRGVLVFSVGLVQGFKLLLTDRSGMCS